MLSSSDKKKHPATRSKFHRRLNDGGISSIARCYSRRRGRLRRNDTNTQVHLKRWPLYLVKYLEAAIISHYTKESRPLGENKSWTSAFNSGHAFYACLGTVTLERKRMLTIKPEPEFSEFVQGVGRSVAADPQRAGLRDEIVYLVENTFPLVN